MLHRAHIGTQRSLCLSAFLFCITAAPLWASNSVPDWVRAAAQQPLPHLPESTKAVILLDDETYTVAPDGRAILHEREVIKILRPQGRRYAEPVVEYDKDSKVLSLHVWSIDPAGHEYALKNSDIGDVATGESFELYNDDRARVADPPGRDPGGIIAYEYEKLERPYLAEDDWFFQGDLPIISQSYTLVLPPGFTYTTTWAHHPKLDAIDLENQHYRWEMNNEPAIDLDQVPMSPSTWSLAGRMTVHYAGPTLPFPEDGTWQGIGEWYTALAKDRVAATPDIAAEAAELTTGKTDFYDRAEAIGNFVQQQIRYVAIEIGIGGNQPHAADDIFRDRYGDCKDKATLLAAMLSTVGIHSDLVMVDSERGIVDPDAPSIVGNHVIAAIAIPSGYNSPKLHSVITAKTGKRYLVFDPTWEETPFGQIEDNLQGSYALLIEGPNSQIIRVPVMNPDLNTVHRTATLQLAPDGSLKGTVTVKRFGDLAEEGREVFTRDDATEQQQYIDHSISGDLMAASLTDLKVQNITALDKDLTTTFDLEASHFANTAGPLLMVRPRVFGTYALPVDHKTRTVPIDLEQAMQGTDDFDIQLPAGYTVDELPDPVKLDLGFAAYQSSTVLQGRTLHYTRTFTVRTVSLPPDQYPALQRLVGIIAADEDSRVILKRGN
ncbi:MAG TPA: DUF3857 and transglutaminase domain-containing protein [Acidobacteriaceae bacterium]|jgi:hypothetical protein|nr:DUF3857 and transglutaminase domain-containing protein [Acidobacteriaceae bacterium]